jgi:hypothetical protein
MHRFTDARFLHCVTKRTPSNHSACEQRRDRTIAWPNRCQSVAYNTPPTLSAFSSNMRANHPIDERRLPPNLQVELAASCARHGCLCVHRHVNCPRTHWYTHAARNNHMEFSLRANCAYTTYHRPIHDCDQGRGVRCRGGRIR